MYRSPPVECHLTLPERLTDEKKHELKEYYNKVPEEFYTRTGLPVIKPSVLRKWLPLWIGATVFLWELYSGAGRLTLGAWNNGKTVVFPVDYRYG